MGAAGEPGEGIEMEAELAHELAERKLSKEKRNVIKDIEFEDMKTFCDEQIEEI